MSRLDILKNQCIIISKVFAYRVSQIVNDWHGFESRKDLKTFLLMSFLLPLAENALKLSGFPTVLLTIAMLL